MIRRANINDLKAMVEINVKAWTINYKGIMEDDLIKSRTTEVVFNRWKESNWIEDENISTFLFIEDNLIKGYVSGSNKRKENDKYDCEIGALYVAPEFQKQGIGKKLLDYMKKHFKKVGYVKMIIWTTKGLPNNGFYKKMGGIL